MVLLAAPASHHRRLGRMVLSALGLVLLAPVAEARLGASDTPPIKLGMSTALTGPAAALGINMRSGVELAITQHNAGLVPGTPKVSLVCLDDGYEPARTAPNMRALIDQHRVTAIVGNVGTPTGVVAVPLAVAAKTPFIGAFTGAALLRQLPPERYVFNFRASYSEEIAAMVTALAEHWKIDPSRIAFFTQRDAYGDAGWTGGVKALAGRGLSDTSAVLHTRYERNTLDVEGCVADLLDAAAPPKAVIMVGAYAPCAKFIRLCRQSQLTPLFLNVSFVGAESLAQAMGPDGDGVIVTQVVPPLDADLPAVRDFHAALRSHPLADRPEPTLTMFEGFLVGRITCGAIARCADSVSAEFLTAAMESLGEFDAGLGSTLTFSPTNHQASYVVWPSIIASGRVVSGSWSELAQPRHSGATP